MKKATTATIDVTTLERYFGKTMYTPKADGKGWNFVPASKAIDGFKNKTVTEIMRPIAEAVVSADFGKRAGIANSVSNAKVIAGLNEVAKALGLERDKDGEKLVFLGCDANAWKHAVSKLSATGMIATEAGSGKIIKATMEVIGKRFRRKYYTVNNEIC